MLPTKLLSDTATLPTRGSETAAGLDLYWDVNSQYIGEQNSGKVFKLKPGERAVLKTGIAMAIPDGYYGQVAPRSGLAVKQGLEILAGVIDSDYRGQLMVAVLNSGQDVITFNHGDRVAQMIILACSDAVPEAVDTLPETVRGDGKFGSTGS